MAIGRSNAHRRQQIIERDGPWCFYCGRHFTEAKPATLEHLVERSAGGEMALANLVLAHEACNQRAVGMERAEKKHFHALLRAAHA